MVVIKIFWSKNKGFFHHDSGDEWPVKSNFFKWNNDNSIELVNYLIIKNYWVQRRHWWSSASIKLEICCIFCVKSIIMVFTLDIWFQHSSFFYLLTTVVFLAPICCRSSIAVRPGLSLSWNQPITQPPSLSLATAAAKFCCLLYSTWLQWLERMSC